MKIIIPYSPRPLQKEIHEQLKRFNVLVCHRRFGKTVLAINELIRKAIQCKLSKPRYAYIAPTCKQAKRVAWDYLVEFCSQIPRVKFSKSELYVSFYGRKIFLLGAENCDTLRGIYLDGVVLDEFADMPPRIWGEIIRPILTDRQGWVLFIGTPKGYNILYEIYNSAVNDSDWFSAIYSATQTGIIAKKELEMARKSMSEAQYLQEFECNFDVTGAGILKREWFKFYKELPEIIKWSWSWDTAIKAGQTNDYSVGGLWGMGENGYYLHDLWFDKVAYPELKRQVGLLYEKHHSQELLIEDKASGQQLVQDFANIKRLPIVPIQPKGDKISRLNIVSATFEAGKVFVPKNQSWTSEYIEQLCLFPHAKHDDMVDMTTQYLLRAVRSVKGYHID